jgi:omega-6 fatty acid desaturase (delta-12 desaturase)
MSGLNGQAIRAAGTQFPSRKEVIAAIPKECFKKDTVKSLAYAATSLAMTLACGAVGLSGVIPYTWAAAPLWLLYGAVTGCVATGCWVAAHECGHGAFSDNHTLQDAVGYALHTALLVPYFSWQRSHAIHHSRTNHTTDGETHVPYQYDKKGEGKTKLMAKVGGPYAVVRLFTHLVFGWPAYLLFGATGGTSRGTTNHFIPTKPFSDALFEANVWKKKVWLSDVGIVAMCAALWQWASVAGAAQVALCYALPLAFTNIWLVLYTWLQHTDTDVPHFEEKDWTYIKGAFMTIDRPYGPIFDFLHHRIGSTHVAHHVDHRIPHYNAVKATEALKKAFPEYYLYDPTPVHKAMWRVAMECIAVRKTPAKVGATGQDLYVFVPPASA